MSRARRRRGFTLIELMVSVAIVGILVSLAIPAFQLYRLQTKASEAKAMIAGIRVNQETFFGANDYYANIIVPNPDPAGPAGPLNSRKRAWDNIPCPNTCPTLPATCTRFSCVGFNATGTVYYTYASPSGQFGANGVHEYAIGAAGDLDDDGVNGSYSYQSGNGGGPIGSLLDTVSSCPLMPAGAPHDCSPTIY